MDTPANDTSELDPKKPSHALPPPRPPIRLWPAFVIAGLGVVVFALLTNLLATSESNPTLMYVGFFTPIATGLLLGLWWLFASRARWSQRLLLLLLFIALTIGTSLVLDPNLVFAYIMFAIPLAAIATLLWWAATPWLALSPRRIGLVAVLVASFAIWLVVRSDGATGYALPTFAWRWTPTAEERYLASKGSSEKPPIEAIEPLSAASEPTASEPTAAEWPGFRGPNRDGSAADVGLSRDWKQTPPRELWRRLVGPAWSSVAVAGDHLFTQEQRGEDEATVCYSVSTGEEAWVHLERVRFEEGAGGPGPRATPTYDAGRLYSLGAKGHLVCLDAKTGKLFWKRDVAAEKEIKVPIWAFCSSPLVLGELVYVMGGGGEGKALLAYDKTTGKPAWGVGEGEMGYSSPQLGKLGGSEQIFVLNQAGLAAFEPKDGKRTLFEPMSAQDQMTLQPRMLGDDLLVSAGQLFGVRRYGVTKSKSEWQAKEKWTANRLKPSFNDVVVAGDRVIGIDGAILACIDLEAGKPLWKGGRYGRGQLLLAGDLLIVQAESGEVALVDARANKFVELGRFAALDAKTWNHPVLVGKRLFVRNGEEMACFELP
jgi:outer membrane protein assembly factor BamB